MNIQIEKKGIYWFAINKELRIFGKSEISENKAIEELGRALINFFEIHTGRGTLKKTLDGFGLIKN